MRQGLLAETLAFQELQREFDAAVRRDVSVTLNNRVYALDGIVEAEGQNYAVEVRFIRNHVSALKRARDIATRLQGLMMPVIFAFVVEDNLVNVDDVRRDAEKIARAYPNFIVRVWPVSELLTKYGLR
jgi:predicted RecB family endonuclease